MNGDLRTISSTQFYSKLSLRFPRVVRIRDDKPPNQVRVWLGLPALAAPLGSNTALARSCEGLACSQPSGRR